MIKRSMRKVLQKNKLIYKDLQTAFIEIEGILNTRPICYIYGDSPDTVIISSHLIYGRNPLTEIPADDAKIKKKLFKTFPTFTKFNSMILKQMEFRISDRT